ncbi:hypothetical protein GCM10009001_07590 [Virgibacillus siamensis]|uniref:Helix-turn-helix conjugative transposon-like domain-containing protein n=1 Tax=Virgibacillus siamensis TaxID=480071 RepID=A0ABN1FMJ3_9BACI
MEEINHRVVQRTKKGDIEAFRKLINFYKHIIYQICLASINDKCIAESVTKDVFLYVYSNIGNYDMNKRFSLWLYSITVNKIMGCQNDENKEFLPEKN